MSDQLLIDSIDPYDTDISDADVSSAIIDGEIDIFEIDGDIEESSEIDGNVGTDDVEGDVQAVGREVDPTVPPWAKKPAPDYEDLENKPTINTTEVDGDKTGEDYHLQNKLTFATPHDIERILYLE